ncbi:hypothetical protein HH213_03990 [Duganella dendranthematis]|jgi:hypothetical protein|uniref:HEAT repeat domain-containing protein n=1 Tax=Duganella dendranthematis TaxID=2728021 RepID=A0ABX6M5S9_9BURK|nr:hypothetical protein [Duganella dendranthematis]QJD89341.1 hypothetical protein HH213_03990 [Duganella dendranthematis]
MTAAFDEFMRQHRMTGSEKADGYSPSVFVDLSEEEKPIVLSLLLQELPWSADWIWVVAPDKAEIVLKEWIEARRGDPYRHVYMAQQSLVRHTGDLRYQQQMVEDYPGYHDEMKHRVVDAIHYTPVNVETIAFFKYVVLEDADADARFAAAFSVLDSLQVPDTAEYEQLLGHLRSEDVELRAAALAQLDQQFGN